MLCDITPRKSVEDLQYLIKSVRDRGFPYEGRGEKDRNWSSYDQAQINEIAEILETIRDVVDEASSRMDAKKRGPGRHAVPHSDVVKVMLMQAYFRNAEQSGTGLPEAVRREVRGNDQILL